MDASGACPPAADVGAAVGAQCAQCGRAALHRHTLWHRATPRGLPQPPVSAGGLNLVAHLVGPPGCYPPRVAALTKPLSFCKRKGTEQNPLISGSVAVRAKGSGQPLPGRAQASAGRAAVRLALRMEATDPPQPTRGRQQQLHPLRLYLQQWRLLRSLELARRSRLVPQVRWSGLPVPPLN